MSVTYTASFTGANGLLLDNYTADTGQTHSNGQDLEIQSNELSSPGAGTVVANVVQTQTYTTGYLVSFDLTVQAGATAKHGMAACTAVANTLYWCRFDPTVDEVQLYKTVAGASTPLGTWAYGSWTGPISVHIEMFITATGLSVEVDGTERITSTDTSITRTGDFGYRMFGNTGVTLDNANFDADPAAPAGPVITNVNTTNIVQVGDVYNVTGTAFLATAGSQTFGGQSITETTWSDTSIANPAFVRGDLNYASHDWIVTDNLAVASAAVSVQLAIETSFQFVALSSPIIALVGGEITSLCYNTSPACVTGDQLRVPTLTDQGKAIDISAADGTFVITAAGNTLQTFDFEIWDANGPANEKWSLSTAAVINGVIVSSGIVKPLTRTIVRSLIH